MVSNLLAALGAVLIVVCVTVLFGLAVAGLVLGVFLLGSAWQLRPPAARAATDEVATARAFS